MFDLKKELSLLPDLPGVYLMYDKEKIIYVGKAKNLKNRVRSYFVKSKTQSVKVLKMVSHIERFEYIITNTELEALMLECTLIKKHRPFYNILLKDDKTYPFIKLTLNKPYPSLSAVRKKENDGARYFGPYTGMGVIRDMLGFIKTIFKIPDCHLRFPEDIGKKRPCINKEMGRCFAPCTGEVTKEEYQNVFYEVARFLSGDHTEIIEDAKRKMEEYSKKLEFEKAARERDKIESIKKFDLKQRVVGSKNADRDVFAFECFLNKAFFACLFIRGGKVVSHRGFSFDSYSDMTDEEISCEAIKSFYSENEIPKEIIIKAEPEDRELLEDWLSSVSGRRVQITAPKRGEKLSLLVMAKANVSEAIKRYSEKREKINKNAFYLEELKEKLRLEKLPKRIESYDISNTGASDRVGAMVVFEDGEYKSGKSRFFKIKYTDGQDDYASMSEVIKRRIDRARKEQSEAVPPEKAAFLPLPDLILLDGGESHVRVIKKLLSEMGESFPVYGMVKDNKHTVRAVTDGESEFSPSKNSEAYKFLYRISERVHKSAIEYHRRLRTKTGLSSELENIAGIGDKRKRLLLKAFKSIENIKNASEEELLKAGLDRKSAKSVFEYFN